VLEQIMELAVAISAADRLSGPLQRMTSGIWGLQKQTESSRNKWTSSRAWPLSVAS